MRRAIQGTRGRRLSFFVLTLVAFLLIGLPGLAQEKKPKRVPIAKPVPSSLERFVGEEFTYRLQILGATAGESTMRVGTPRKWRGRQVIPLLGSGKTTGFWRNLYPIDNSILSLVNAKTGLPVRTEMRVETKDRLEDYRFEFRRKRGSIIGAKKKDQLAPKNLARKIHRRTHDLISWLFAMRIADLTPGTNHSLHTFSGNHAYQVSMSVGDLEIVWTPSGSHDAVHIRGKVHRLGGSTFEREFSVWITPDQHRTPVKLSFDTKLGPAKALLKRIRKTSG